jgi:hypothetical protein
MPCRAKEGASRNPIRREENKKKSLSIDNFKVLRTTQRNATVVNCVTFRHYSLYDRLAATIRHRMSTLDYLRNPDPRSITLESLILYGVRIPGFPPLPPPRLARMVRLSLHGLEW